MSRKIRKFWTDKFDTRSKHKFDSCNSCKRLVPSRLHALHESKLLFVSRIEFICSKLYNFFAYVSGVNVSRRHAPCAYSVLEHIARLLRLIEYDHHVCAKHTACCICLLEWFLSNHISRQQNGPMRTLYNIMQSFYCLYFGVHLCSRAYFNFSRFFPNSLAAAFLMPCRCMEQQCWHLVYIYVSPWFQCLRNLVYAPTQTNWHLIRASSARTITSVRGISNAAETRTAIWAAPKLVSENPSIVQVYIDFGWLFIPVMGWLDLEMGWHSSITTLQGCECLQNMCADPVLN